MRLTVELVGNSLSYLNPLKERELDLREEQVDSNSGNGAGHKIPLIENLGVARDQDAIDFTDNDIQQLGNFPLSPRLRTLLLARNRIGNIQQNVASSIPNLTTLVLTANNLAQLADLDPLAGLKQLTHLVLLENPVVRLEHYRPWIVWRCPSIRFLDFRRVRDVERKEASDLFGTAEEPSSLASEILGQKSKTFDVPGSSTATNGVSSSRSRGGGPGVRVKLTEAEKKRVQELIRNATSMQEVERIERDLAEGRIPGGIRADVEMRG